MGNFYGNIVVKGPSREAITVTLDAQERVAVLLPTADGLTAIFPADEYESDDLCAIAASITAAHACAALVVMNNDDDALYYWLFANGTLRDRYDSSRNDVEENDVDGDAGDARTLCGALGVADRKTEVAVLLRGPFLFAVERHAALSQALGLPASAVGLGYHYIERGEQPLGTRRTDLLHVGRRGPHDAGEQEKQETSIAPPNPELGASSIFGPLPAFDDFDEDMPFPPDSDLSDIYWSGTISSAIFFRGAAQSQVAKIIQQELPDRDSLVSKRRRGWVCVFDRSCEEARDNQPVEELATVVCRGCGCVGLSLIMGRGQSIRCCLFDGQGALVASGEEALKSRGRADMSDIAAYQPDTTQVFAYIAAHLADFGISAGQLQKVTAWKGTVESKWFNLMLLLKLDSTGCYTDMLNEIENWWEANGPSPARDFVLVRQGKVQQLD